MVAPIIATNVSMTRGTCPHGNPIGACPICSGGGGGGGAVSSLSKKGTVQGGMTWDECFAYLRTVKNQRQNVQDEKQFQTASAINFTQNSKIGQFMENKMTTVMAFFQINISRPVTNFANRIFSAFTNPIANLTKSVANTALADSIKNFTEKLQKNIVDISNKIASMIGEPIMAAAKFISDTWQKLKSKKFLFFSPVDTEMEQGEQEEEIELKKWFGIKNLKKNMGKFLKLQKDNKDISEWL